MLIPFAVGKLLLIKCLVIMRLAAIHLLLQSGRLIVWRSKQLSLSENLRKMLFSQLGRVTDDEV